MVKEPVKLVTIIVRKKVMRMLNIRRLKRMIIVTLTKKLLKRNLLRRVMAEMTFQMIHPLMWGAKKLPTQGVLQWK